MTVPEATDALFMAQCRLLAAEAAARGESPVGALLVRAGVVVARATEATRQRADVTAHAELLALQQARQQLGPDLSGCTLYSTHEPCVMCAYAIRYHRLGRVVYGQVSEYLGGATSIFALLTSPQVPPHWAAPPVVEQWSA